MLTNRPPFVEYSDTFSWRQIQNIIMNVFEFPILLVIVAGFLPLFDSKSSKCEGTSFLSEKFRLVCVSLCVSTYADLFKSLFL